MVQKLGSGSGGSEVSLKTTPHLLPGGWLHMSWKCRSAGQEGTFPLLPEVTNFRPSPSWKSPFSSCSSVVFSFSSFALWSSGTPLFKVFVKTLLVSCLYTLMVCSLLTFSWSSSLETKCFSQSTAPTRKATNVPSPKTGSRHSCSCNLDSYILLPKLQLGQGIQYDRQLLQEFWEWCPVAYHHHCCTVPSSPLLSSTVSGSPSVQTHNLIAKKLLCCSWVSLTEITVNWTLKCFSVSGPRFLQHSLESSSCLWMVFLEDQFNEVSA